MIIITKQQKQAQQISANKPYMTTPREKKTHIPSPPSQKAHLLAGRQRVAVHLDGVNAVLEAVLDVQLLSGQLVGLADLSAERY